MIKIRIKNVDHEIDIRLHLFSTSRKNTVWSPSRRGERPNRGRDSGWLSPEQIQIPVLQEHGQTVEHHSLIDVMILDVFRHRQPVVPQIQQVDL